MPHETLVSIHFLLQDEGLCLDVMWPQGPIARDNTLLYAFSFQNYMLNRILFFNIFPSLQCVITARGYSIVQGKSTMGQPKRCITSIVAPPSLALLNPN